MNDVPERIDNRVSALTAFAALVDSTRQLNQRLGKLHAEGNLISFLEDLSKQDPKCCLRLMCLPKIIRLIRTHEGGCTWLNDKLDQINVWRTQNCRVESLLSEPNSSELSRLLEYRTLEKAALAQRVKPNP